jgi:hypothetical protein
MSLRKAIDAMCKNCIYDPHQRGGWKQQVTACTSPQCPLFPHRPKSDSKPRQTGHIFDAQKRVSTHRMGVSKSGETQWK